MTCAIATSADGVWAAIRVGSTLSVIEQPPTEVSTTPTVQLATDVVDLAIVIPGGIVVVEHAPGAPSRVLLLSLPELEATAAIELDATYRIVACTGTRLVLGNGTAQYVIVRVAPRALAAQALESGVADFVAGMDKHQLVFGLAKKIEIWDAVSGRPMVKLQLQLPPPPRLVGTALGHLFVTRPGSDEVYVYRLSDGRPFRHQAGSKVERTISHPSSGIVVLVTPRGLVRINCFAHSVTMIDSPYTPGTALAIHGTGDAVTLLGVSETGAAWRVGLEAHAAPSESVSVPPAFPTPSQLVPMVPITPIAPVVQRRSWRPALVETAHVLLRGELTSITLPDDSELTQLAVRLGLGAAAHRALATLYALYLIGETPSIALLAQLTEDWTEPLGQGELRKLLDRTDGRIRLRSAIAEFLDGAGPMPEL